MKKIPKKNVIVYNAPLLPSEQRERIIDSIINDLESVKKNIDLFSFYRTGYISVTINMLMNRDSYKDCKDDVLQKILRHVYMVKIESENIWKLTVAQNIHRTFIEILNHLHKPSEANKYALEYMISLSS